MRQTCTDHCAGCGRHFHGLGAFDAHRREGECCDPEMVVGQRGKHEGEALLQVWTETGSCDKDAGCWKDGKRDHYVTPVVVWQRTGNDFSWVSDLRASEETAQEAVAD